MNEKDINCFGHGSCSGSMINNIGDGSDGSTLCWGLRSCQSVSVFKGTVRYPADLRGYLAAAWSQSVNTSYLPCYGEASCYRMENTTSDTVHCHGFRSCSELQGNNNQDVTGNGVLSLENSIFHNPSNVYLHGFYSGYNSTIYCDYDKICNIHCYSNGCENLNLFCGNADNHTKCNNDNNTNYIFNVCCNETKGIICPNGWGDDHDYNITNTKEYQGYNLLQTIFGDFNFSMYSLDSVSVQSKYVKDIHHTECSESGYNNNIKCGDSWGCTGDSLINKNNVCCDAYRSCSYSNISSFNNLFCDGTQACTTTGHTISGTYIDGDGVGNVFIRARHALKRVINFKSMMLSAYEGVAGGIATNGILIACFAFQSFSSYSGGSIITGVSNIYAGGYRAIYDSVIYSGGIGEMNIYFLGFQSVYQTDIICNKDDICNVYCFTDDACDNIGDIDIACDDNLNCTINILYGLSPTSFPTIMPSTSILPTQQCNHPTNNPSTNPDCLF